MTSSSLEGPAHHSRAVRHRLHEMFANRVVALYYEVEWTRIYIEQYGKHAE